MPVIKEKRQFLTQPIGVARASRGGEITGEAISRAAGQLNDIAFKFAAKDAEERGETQAKSIDAAQITGIDPSTGGPKALSNIASMGQIQSDAYKRIIDRRFEESIEEEMRLKSKELALNTPDPEKYDTLMSSYMADMVNGAKGTPYSEYISNTGSVYLNQTKLVLKDEAIARAKAAQKKAQAEANARSESLAYNIGVAAGSNSNGYNQADASMSELIGNQVAATDDLGQFTGAPTDLSKAGDKILNSYAVGILEGSLANLSKQDRSRLSANLAFGSEFTLSESASHVFNKISNLANGDREKMSAFGAEIYTSVNRLNAIDTDAEINASAEAKALDAAEKLSGENLTNQFSALTIEITNDVDQSLWGVGQDINTALEKINKLMITDPRTTLDSGISETAITKRNSALDKAKDQLLNNAIFGLIEGKNFTEAKINEIRDGIKSNNLSALFEAVGDVSTSDQSVFSSLLNETNPSDVLSALESKATLLKGQEAFKAKRQKTYVDTNKPALLAKIFDGTATWSEIDEFAEEAGSSYSSVKPEIDAALGGAEIRSLIVGTEFNSDSKGMLKEVGLLSKGTAFSETATPILNRSGLRDKVVSALEKVKDLDLRKAIVGNILDAVPADGSATLRQKEYQSFVGRASEMSETRTLYSNSGIADMRQKYIKEIKDSEILNETQKKELISNSNTNLSVSIGNRIFGDMDENQMNQAIVYLQDKDSQNNLPAPLKQQLDLIIGPNADQGDVSSIVSSLSGLIPDLIKAKESMQKEKNADDVAIALANGHPIETNEENIGYVRDVLLRKVGLEEQPADLFQNGPAYLAAFSEDDPNFKGGLYLRSMLSAASKNGVAFPELKQFFIKAANGGSIGDTPIDPSFVANIVAGIGYDQDSVSAGIVQTSVFDSMGLDDVTKGVLSGLGQASVVGFDSAYLPKIAEALRDPKGSMKSFEAVTGGPIEDFINKAVDAKWFSNELPTNPQVLKEMTNYALGLHLAGMDESQIKANIRNFVKQAYQKDEWTVSGNGRVSTLSRVNINRSFGKPSLRAAALMLHQVEMYASIGKGMLPEGSLAEQIEQGKVSYSQKYKTVQTGSKLSSIRSGMTPNLKEIVYVPRYNDTNATAVYTPYVRNFDGTITAITDFNASKLKARNPSVNTLSNLLETIDSSKTNTIDPNLNQETTGAFGYTAGVMSNTFFGAAGGQTLSKPQIIESAVIKFYLENNGG